MSEIAFLAAAVLVLFSPIVLSMRLHDIGWSPIWGLIPLIGLVIMFYMAFEAMIAVSGTPGLHQNSSTDTLMEWLVYGSIVILLLLSVVGIFVRSKHVTPINEVHS